MTGEPLRFIDHIGRENVASAVRYAEQQFSFCKGDDVPDEALVLIGDLARLLILRQAEHKEWSTMGIGCARDMGNVLILAEFANGAIHVKVLLPAFVRALETEPETLN